MSNILQILIISVILTTILCTDCSVSDPSKLDCGFMGISQSQCESKGCCWFSSSSHEVPWCFYPAGTPDVCQNLTFVASNPGFSDSDITKIKDYFYKNLNIDGKGGVVASPDTQTPGGSYYYAWARDGALSMKSFMVINEFKLDQIQTNMNAYVQWVLNVHSEIDPNNIDIRIEPKFNLPNGDPYTGGWCRPQTDAPGLRATTLSLYANVLIKEGQKDFVSKYLWTNSDNVYKGGAIKNDLEWVVSNWQQNSCDLWEEIRSDDFFWGRFTSRRGLLEGAKIAELMGDSNSAAKYRKTAQDIENLLENHWTGEFIKETDNRQKDSAVVSALNDGFFNDDVFKPTDAKVANTIKTLNELFCHSFPINQLDIKNNIPGVFYGRYQGDSYAGGNPWILLTADLAKLLYRGANLIIDEIHQYGAAKLKNEDILAWIQTLNLNENELLDNGFLNNYKDYSMAKALISAGDAVLQKIYYHTQGDDFHFAEQLDKNTGTSKSAKDLSWSYATVLVAYTLRSQALIKLQNNIIV